MSTREIQTNQLVLAVVVIILLAFISVYVYEKQTTAKQNPSNCSEQIAKDNDVCNPNKNNMLFVGCNGFF